MSFIFTIFIIMVVYLTIYKKKKSLMDDSGDNMRKGQTTIHVTPPQQRRQNAPYHRNVQNEQITGQSVMPASQSQKGTTTAYLNAKARQDAIEHAKNDMEEQRRLERAHGNIRVAERLFDGDSVPDGKRCVVCGYCGAENLVPFIQREPYGCYFCREILH